MLKRKQTKAIQKFIYSVFKQFWQLSRAASRQLSRWLARNLLNMRYKRRYANAKSGFVLPTVTVLLLVVALVIGAILFRTGTRTNQVMGQREEQTIYNAATPAIERAKAKLEYLFLRDSRLPNGTPSDNYLMSMLLNGENPDPNYQLASPLTTDPYVLDDEKRLAQELGLRGRLDLNGDGNPDPAWAYKTDVDGDGKDEIVVYSILLKKRDGTGVGATSIDNKKDEVKAKALVVRNGPMKTVNISDPVCASLTGSSGAPAASTSPTDPSAWESAGSATLRKTFQVDAIVISNKPGNSRTVATLEFQQDRQLDKVNKWGAWFRNDLEISPGSAFRWNGAMYTAGNLIVGTSNVKGYLISSPKSCFYTKDASEVTIINKTPTPADPTDFRGLLVSGKVQDNSTDGGSSFHVHKRDNSQDDNAGNTKVDASTDSSNQSKPISELILNPVKLITEDISEARVGDTTNRNAFNSAFESTSASAGTIGYLNARGRVINRTESVPYVDDTYRADDRYGPKPLYGRVTADPSTSVKLDGGTKRNGNTITTASDARLLTNNNVAANDTEFKTLGLDGYWERRARAEGLRIIVGQRLKLGNTYGWGVTDLNGNGNVNEIGEKDPLYPADRNGTTHEAQQRRALRDNLAAVQATAVYHYNYPLGNANAYFPVAFVATTAHPGTGDNSTGTIGNSKNFDLLSGYDYTQGGTPYKLFSDFFSGKGSNGWEYEVVPGNGNENEASFGPRIDNGGDPLRIALENLANFAGDYNSVNQHGAFPPTQAPSDGSNVPHPYPYLTMWGNFSNLKRTLMSGTLYQNLSIADKSYIHTAAGTLGILANNINHYDNYNYTSHSQVPALNTELIGQIDGSAATDLITSTGTGFNDGNNGSAITQVTAPTDIPAFQTALTTPVGGRTYAQRLSDLIKVVSPDRYVSAITNAAVKPVAELTNTKLQIQRDRTWGFATPNPTTYNVKFTSGSSTTAPETSDPFNPIADDYTGAVGSNSNPVAQALRQIDLPCNPADYEFFHVNTANPTQAPTNAADERKMLATAIALCPRQPKYPSLYYIFPVANHVFDDDGAPAGANPANQPSTTPNAEPYISDSYVRNATRANPNFRVVALANVLLRPKQTLNSQACSETNWCLPITQTAPTGTAPGREDFRITIPAALGGGNRWVSLIDNALFNGREMMNVRVLDVNLDLLRNSTMQTNNDRWFPASGVVYAFREDAVREDAIARSASGTSTNATNPISPTDPALTANGISPKPVDYYPDPDRRPYGFRLRNGKDLRRDVDNPRGLTFISDNGVYVQGDFNLHSTDGVNNNLEEFKQPLGDDWGNFYTRTDLQPLFARIGSGKDNWRPAEILGDAVTILSDSFNAGNIEAGIRDNGGLNSYRSLNGPNSQQTWVREDNSTNSALPIKISRNGNPIFCANGNNPCTSDQQREYTGGYRSFGTNYSSVINQARATQINATIISGIVPSRSQQTYGGFHNFPRMIEKWSGVTQRISGSFVQLNFSTSNTGLFDQDAWEPAQNPQGAEWNFYYDRPERQWGYDVGLQYAPAGPVAQRFMQTPASRSEFYRDLPVSDPYICRLRRALNSRRSDIDPASTTECPA